MTETGASFSMVQAILLLEKWSTRFVVDVTEIEATFPVSGKVFALQERNFSGHRLRGYALPLTI